MGLAAGDAHLAEMAHLEDGFALVPTEEKVREAKRYLLSGDALDAFALARQAVRPALMFPGAAPHDGRELGNLADEDGPGGLLGVWGRLGDLDAVGVDLLGLVG